MSFDIAKYPTLALVDSTQELRLLPKDSLPKLCDELRRYLLDSVSRSSGHFASGLGTVELTVALHYVYNTPFDRLIWDVGHQAYPHKILTGRRDQIGTIRQKGGLHPFPWRGESEYDVLSVGHSSTSISAGIGIAIAAAKEDKQRRAVCVIGDGAITAGMAFEAMNHAGVKAVKKSSPAYRRLKSCSNAPRNISKGWWFRGRCLKSWALTTLGRWTATMLSVWLTR